MPSPRRVRPASMARSGAYLESARGSRVRAAHALHRSDELFGVNEISVINIDGAQDDRAVCADQIRRRNGDQPFTCSGIAGWHIAALEVNGSQLRWQGVGDSVGDRNLHAFVDQC
jgi:hypothetical protein